MNAYYTHTHTQTHIIYDNRRRAHTPALTHRRLLLVVIDTHAQACQGCRYLSLISAQRYCHLCILSNRGVSCAYRQKVPPAYIFHRR